MAPVLLALRMHTRVPVDLRRGGLKDFGAQALGQSQHVNGAVYAGFRSLDWIVLVMDRGGGTGQIIDLISLDIERKCHVVADDFKPMIPEHDLDIAARASEIIINADDIGARLEQALAQVGAQKSGAASNQYTSFEVQVESPQ